MSSVQAHSRKTLDEIIQQSILIYRWAVYISFALIGAGFLVAIISDETVDTEMKSPSRLVQQMFELHASGFFGIGIGVMILAPIVMIALSAAAFYRAGDKRYGLISTAVAVILSLSIAISFLLG